ncbi:AAA family ATPase [Salinirubellus salinus]|uniref:AAA family ATPase n=1 Tax=Salinirubellus salinus TaxID=1364945 RepID=A0A9E7UBZ4_9EURY|nr:AAA family ATPase [Salinirubellus salinus]UWM55773.1 AAA family ATPase [Salinirubellus salinus]
MDDSRSVTLTVRGAEKRDAGRGVARLPEGARKALGVLSGDTVVIEGDRATVAKVWPGSGPEGELRVDADTRANAGVTIGDSVTVRQVAVADASDVRVEVPATLTDDDLREMVAEDLLDRPLRAGETVRLERLGVRATVTATSPDGTVRVTDRTDVTLVGKTDDGKRVRPSRTGTSRVDTPEPETGAGAESPSQSPEEPGRATGAYGVTYEDIGGLDEELELVREMIELPLSEPELFQQFGVEPPKGVLLHGPPGTGKTLIARAVANEVAAHFVVVNGPEIVSKYKGDSEERLREKFEEATENQPAIIFIDEIDSIAGSRDEDADMENRLVAQLLTLLDGLEERGQVIVIGATNRVDTLDPALRRGGRFDREIEIGAPSADGRREILDVHTRGMTLAEDVDLDALTARTHGFVGADLQSLAKEAGMNAIREREYRETREVTAADFEGALKSVEPSAMREYVAEAPEATFADVGGLDEAKQTLTEAVMWPLQYHRLFDVTRTDPPSGVLLYGPPGTGKTLLARALAGESEVNFIHVNGPEVLDRYVGESEKAVRKVFDRARQAAPSIVFLDEIDAIAGRRGEGHEVTERVVSQLLTEMDGLEDNPNVVVLAATNRREVLDPALLRPGRLESHVEVPLPDEAARRAILEVHGAGKPFAEDVSVASLAAETAGYSGAELEALVREASMRAIREFAREVGPAEANERADEIVVGADHFAAAREAVERSKVD